MNAIETFIGKHVDLSGLTQKQKREVTVETLRLVFKFVSVSQFDARFRHAIGVPVRTIELRREILRDGYIMKNLKLWYYYVMANGMLRKQRAAVAEMFAINEDDIELLKLAGEFQKDFNKLIKTGFKALTLVQFEKNMSWQLGNKKINTFLAKYVYRSMRFIFQSQGIEPEDLIQELKTGALQSVLELYPRIKTAEHCANYIKKCTHNAGQNLIDFYSGEKRGKFLKYSDGSFDNKIVPISYAVTDENFQEFLSSGITGDNRDHERELQVQKILSQYDGKRQRFLQLLMGYDAEFTAWLHSNKVTRKDNEDYMDSCGDTKIYISHALDFLGVKREAGDKFISQLRNKFA